MRPSAARADAPTRADLDAFASDVEYYLQLAPRQLPSRYFYDALGSALFDAICELPWYPITRAEQLLLDSRAADILEYVDPLTSIVELGPGSGEKLATLLSPRFVGLAPRMTVHLVDVSRTALERASHTLASLNLVDIVAHQATYESGLAQATAGRGRSGRLLALFLGSNIGNFDPPGADAFLRTVRASLAPGDALLLGTDLVKPRHTLVRAYDDPLGVTAAFNRNLLVRINRELGGDFDVDRFAHRALWNEAASRVEMHLVSTCRQRVRIERPALTLDLAADEPIWTESSYKYRRGEVEAMLARASFGLLRQWTDPEAAFALSLAQAE
jgi:dimethylhistidine N-methyltransferase